MKRQTLFLLVFLIAPSFNGMNIIAESPSKASIRKVKDVVIYDDTLFYSAFPSIVKRPDGELFVAFRRAPNRNAFGERGNSHVDPNSYLVMVRSNDGETWTKNPELI